MGGAGPFTPSFIMEILQGTDVGLDVRVLVPAGRGQGAGLSGFQLRVMKEAALQGECWPGPPRHRLHDNDSSQSLCSEETPEETSAGQGHREV